jgi:signal transduction histidine kinase
VIQTLKEALGTRALVAIAGTLLAVILFLLVMSNRTGQDQFDEAQSRLHRIESLNLQLDGALFFSMFEIQMDFDDLTDLTTQLRTATAELRRVAPPSVGDELETALERRLAFIEDYKSAHAVLRNSRAIAAQMFAELRNRVSPTQHDQRESLSALERAYLDFVGRRDPVSGALLDEALATVRTMDELSSFEQWNVLDAHLRTLRNYIERIGPVLFGLYAVPFQDVIRRENAKLAERLARTSNQAGRYRVALFAVAVVLLVLAMVMVLKLRQYLRMVHRANDELESRVAKRTAELAAANSALLGEMAEREKIESQLRLAQKLEAIGQLAAGVAHEINTPVQYALHNVEFVADVWQDLAPVLDDYERAAAGTSLDPERARRTWAAAAAARLRAEVPTALREAYMGLERISKIVLAINNFSHPGSETFRPADLNGAIENTVTVASNEWKYVAKVELDLDRSLPAVPCDLSALNQVILNLVVNAAQAIAAAHAGRRPGRILISTRRLAEEAEIVVEDNGPGVPLEIRHRVFDPFFTTKDVGKGTGQGLAIAHRIVHRQHGGTLTVAQATIGGARFVIRLPLRRDEAAPNAVALAASA